MSNLCCLKEGANCQLKMSPPPPPLFSLKLFSAASGLAASALLATARERRHTGGEKERRAREEQREDEETRGTRTKGSHEKGEEENNLLDLLECLSFPESNLSPSSPCLPPPPPLPRKDDMYPSSSSFSSLSSVGDLVHPSEDASKPNELGQQQREAERLKRAVNNASNLVSVGWQQRCQLLEYNVAKNAINLSFLPSA